MVNKVTVRKSGILSAPRRIESLTDDNLARAARRLARLDADLGEIYRAHGTPPMWGRDEGFPTLVHIILEQQVSLASARAAFERLKAAAPVTPEQFLRFDDDELKQIGFSRQKTRYCRLLSEVVLEGQLDLTALNRMPDDEVRATLTRLKGVGDWTVDIYLLMALRRPDVLPKGDLALAVALQQVKRLNARPTPDQIEAIGEAWRPHRAVAARLLWHFYLNR